VRLRWEGRKKVEGASRATNSRVRSSWQERSNMMMHLRTLCPGSCEAAHGGMGAATSQHTRALLLLGHSCAAVGCQGCVCWLCLQVQPGHAWHERVLRGVDTADTGQGSDGRAGP
jgi:hypothetical protein